MPIYSLNDQLSFPPVEGAVDGIVAVGGDLSSERLLLAYQNGIFPWYSDDEPILWWCPDPRFILLPEELHISKSMHRVLRNPAYKVTMDTDFISVIQHCATTKRKGEYGTWITDDMIEAYCCLHEEGYAHSVEVWINEQLVGGLYGVSLGKCFFAESMFHKADNASKIALITLVQYLKQKGFLFLDAQVHTSHVATLGANNIPRTQFIELLKKGVHEETQVGKWHLS